MNEAPFLIDQNGDWYYNKSKITRHSMVKLFSTILVRDEDNTFHLRTPVEDVLIEVLDAPYLIKEMYLKQKDRLPYIYFKTNVDYDFMLNKKNPLWLEKKNNSDELIPYVLVKKGLIAKLSRVVYYQLVDLLELKIIKNVSHYGVYSGKDFFFLDKPKSRNKYL
ncbi:MAG: hypothetical protein CFH33_00192 [Alphaproteobacteria bacterium MarineAlpha9_Bin3]|nr:MAG: hypothetical protein CFH33_00192 [Alphaproteobacteria bacterium MarineAlpha9_Bin3]|tara:strand:- start:1107 stop:1598 length:492 start_codon:yes stop_codon:yes gene_type:complete